MLDPSAAGGILIAADTSWPRIVLRGRFNSSCGRAPHAALLKPGRPILARRSTHLAESDGHRCERRV